VLCDQCAADLSPAPPGVVPALLAYDGAGRALVTALKYRNQRGALRLVGQALARRAPSGGVDAVTWAPTTPARRRARGFDQAELLARSVARALGCPCLSLLRRPPGPPQTGRTRVERLDSPSFEVRPPVPRRILLVDDVVTTGATLRAAAATLRLAGAAEVALLALAATPGHRAGAAR
jgi:predicted amidophosphoribosyltransferase